MKNPPTLPSSSQGRAAPGTTAGVEPCCFHSSPTSPSASRHCFGRALTPSHRPASQPHQKASHAISPWTYLLPSRSDCFRSPRMPSHLGRTSVFMTFRNCLLAPANPCNPSLRLQPCLGDRFRAAVTASEALACHLTLDGPLFLRRSETAFWHPQTLVTPRCASSRPSETVSEPQ